jgi:ADP-ribose pyrophosphatase YjhB (NUDIX family)
VTTSRRPPWLQWAQSLQTIAHAGLAYSKDPFDLERFTQLQALAAEILANHTDAAFEEIHGALQADAGYVTPKVDVRAVVFDDRDRVLLVREASDGCWSLPGGWADLGQSGSEVAVREVHEEAGYDVRATKLLAVLDKAKHDHPVKLWSVYKLFFRCELIGGAARPSLETPEVDWFEEGALPPLSIDRNTSAQLARMFEHLRAPELPTDFD